MADPNVLSLNDQNFEAEVLKAGVPVLVDFMAVWAGPCKQMEPIIDKIADDYKGKVKVGKLDIDESPNTTRKYGIRSVPTQVVFKGGAKSGEVTGLTSREKLLQLLGV
ncbi:thioredoxin [Archangium gephyra]|nr:thioredoxin [Archangium gephyra]